MELLTIGDWQVIGFVELAADVECESGFPYRLGAALGVVALCTGFHVLRLTVSVIWAGVGRWMIHIRQERLHQDDRPGTSSGEGPGRRSGEGGTTGSEIADRVAPASSSIVHIDSAALQLKRRSTGVTLLVLLTALVTSTVLPFGVMVALLFPLIFPAWIYTIHLMFNLIYPLFRPHYQPLGSPNVKPNLGWWYLSLSAAGFGLVFAAAIGGGFVCPYQTLDSSIETMVACLLFLLLATLLMRLARWWSTMRSSELLGKDGGSPVLYLRSFHDDAVKVPVSFFSPLTRTDYFLGPHRQRFEVVVTALLSAYGPVVALAKPGWRMPPIGASREELGNDTWQRDIQEWLTSSQIIVVAVGGTAGLQWELEQIARLGLTPRLLLLFPPVGEVELRHRWRQLFNAQSNPVDAALTAVMSGDEISTVYVGRKRDEWYYAAAIAAALREVDRSQPRTQPSSGLTARQQNNVVASHVNPKRYKEPDAAPPLSSTGLYLFADESVIGPYTSLELRRMAYRRQVSARTPVAAQGRWLPLGQLPGIYSSRSWKAALALSIIVGFLGADRFYLGKMGTGLMKGLALGACGVWWLMDIALLGARVTTDAKGRPLQ